MGGMSNGEASRDPLGILFLLDSKKIFVDFCHKKYIFNTNHDDCITKILNKVNSRAKVQSPKIRNNNPVEPKNHTNKPGRQNGIGQRFSLNKSSIVHEKPHTPRSCLRWKPTGRIFKTVSLRWIPTGKVFIEVNLQMVQMMISLTHMNAIKLFMLVQEFKEFKSDEHSSNDVWTKQFKPRSSSNDIWSKRFKPRSLMSNGVYLQKLQKNPIFHISVDISRTQTSLGHSLHQQIPFYLHSAVLGTSTHDAKTKVYSFQTNEAEEEAVAREVHATHARIVSGPDPEPMQEDQTGSNSGKLHVSLAGPNPEHMDDELTEAEEEAVAREVHATHARIVSGPDLEPMQEDQTGSNSGKLHEKSKVIEESDSTIPDPSHQTVTSTPPVIAPFTDVSSTKPSSLVTPPPINTEATTITTSLPEITPFIALQLRVARLEQEMSEVKKTDHSADVLASIKSQVPTVVDKYLGTKLDDALLKILERHTADLIEKYSALPGPESIKNQESEKSPKEIIRIKREQGEEKQDSTYSIRSTDKVALEEFDLKSALFKHMNKNKTANRNPANYHLYHALMEALIADEDAMDKEVAVKVKDHKRKHDSDDEEDDDDDDEGPSAGSNQGRSAKRKRPGSAASRSAQPPSKHDQRRGLMIRLRRQSEAADIMKALKESKKMSKRQPGTGGSNEGTGNILGVPDESTVISRASSEGTGSKPGVPDEEKLIL
ncbi:hypothetical protein Tco_1020684 [Tanacetum coccineum]